MGDKLPAFTIRTLINNYGGYIKSNLGMDELEIQKEHVEYMDKQPEASVRDYMWSLFQRIILNGGDSYTHWLMGQFIAQYEGKDGKLYQRLSLKQQLDAFKNEYGNRNDKIIWGFSIIGNKNCAHSMKHDTDYVDFEEYSEILPLANDECSLKSCTCCIVAVAKRDDNGKLIWSE